MRSLCTIPEPAHVLAAQQYGIVLGVLTLALEKLRPLCGIARGFIPSRSALRVSGSVGCPTECLTATI